MGLNEMRTVAKSPGSRLSQLGHVVDAVDIEIALRHPLGYVAGGASTSPRCPLGSSLDHQPGPLVFATTASQLLRHSPSTNGTSAYSNKPTSSLILSVSPLCADLVK